MTEPLPNPFDGLSRTPVPTVKKAGGNGGVAVHIIEITPTHLPIPTKPASKITKCSKYIDIFRKKSIIGIARFLHLC